MRCPARLSLASSLGLVLGALGLGLLVFTRTDPAPVDQVLPNLPAANGVGATASAPRGVARTASDQRVPIPEDLRQAVRTAIEQDVYRIRPRDLGTQLPGTHVAVNPGQRLQFGFSAQGVHVRPHHAAERDDWTLDMTLRCVGHGPAPDLVGAGALSATDNRIEYRRTTAGGAAIIEWYVNTPRGMEQGFTVPVRTSAGARTGEPLRVAFSIAGDVRAKPAASGRSIAFTTAAGRRAFGYSELHAYDAAGNELPSRMAVLDGSVELVVDDQDADYPLTIDPLFSTVTKLNATDAAFDDHFGTAVAIHGDTALVGAPEADTGSLINPGAAYVFVRDGSGWIQQARLTAGDPASGDSLGAAVALSADTAVLGAWRKDAGPDIDAGAAYVFVRSGSAWTQQAKLTSTTPAGSDFFGHSVAVDGDTAVIGAWASDDKGDRSGAVHVFARSGSTWAAQARLTASDGGAGDQFGWSVGIDADTLVAGAPNFGPSGSTATGAAYVFVRSAGTWSEQAKLTASDAEYLDFFGSAVALSGDSALVGAWRDDHTVGGNVLVNAGSAYVFVRSGGTWTEQAKLIASDAQQSAQFGGTVALAGDTALIGARFDDDGALIDAGAAYAFVRSGSTWSQQSKLRALEPSANEAFGISVAIDADTALVGCFLDDNFAGSVFVFEPPRDPATLLQDLIDDVKAVNTNNNIANTSLEAKLDAAVQALDDLNANNDTAAIQALNAFINAVQAQSGKAITTEESTALIAAAQQIIDLVQGA